MSGFQMCDDGTGTYRMRVADRLVQCCDYGWFLGLYAAAQDTYYTDFDLPGDPVTTFVFQVYSIRADLPNGDTVTVTIDIQFTAEDPDDPYVDEDNPGSVVLVRGTATKDFTVGYETGGTFEYLGTVGGTDVDYVGSLGTPATVPQPTTHLWQNSFGSKTYRQPPEYGIFLNTAASPGFETFVEGIPGSPGTPGIPYPVHWQDAADAAQALLDPDNLGFPAFAIYGRGDDSHVERFGTAFPMDVFYFNAPADKQHSFIQPRFPTPTAKKTDEAFTLNVKQWCLYLRRFLAEPPGNEVDNGLVIQDGSFVIVPLLTLRDVTDQQQLFVPTPTFDAGMFIGYDAFGGPFGYKYNYVGCYILAKEGTHQIKARQLTDPLSGGGSSVGISEYWWFYSGLVRVTRSNPYQYRVHKYDTGDLRDYLEYQPVSGSIPLGDDGTGQAPLNVRIVDFAGAQLMKEWNLCTEATTHVVASLANLGGNAHGSPGVDGTTEKDCVGGVATFDALKVVGLGRNYELRFTTPTFDYDEANGPPLSSTPGDVYHRVRLSIACALRINDPGTQAAGVDFDVVVDIVDADGNVISPTTVDDVTLSDDGGFTGSGTQTPSSGSTTFTGNFPTPGTYTLKVETSRTTYDGPNDGSGDIPAVTLMVTVT